MNDEVKKRMKREAIYIAVAVVVAVIYLIGTGVLS